jgi:hypothetical protein
MPEDLLQYSENQFSLDDLLKSDQENRARNKDVRTRTAELLNRRLARDITMDEYTVTRKNLNEEAAECKRRASLLALAICALENTDRDNANRLNHQR